MAGMIDEDDFAAYMDATKFQAKVHPGSAFAAGLRAQFADRSGEKRLPHMFSTKLRRFIDFRPGEVTAWAGYSGHRKSMFTGQVALDLCVQKQPTLMASFEMLPAVTLARMARQAHAILRPSDKQLDHFARWTDGRLWFFDHMGTVSPATCMGVCRYFADKLQGAHVFIDSMMMVCTSEESLDEQKQFSTGLIRLAQETGMHVHIVVHCRKPKDGDDSNPPSKYDVRGSASITDQAHNVITVWANKERAQAQEEGPQSPAYADTLDEPDAIVSIEKQRNGRFEGRTKLWFDEASMRFMDDRISAVEPYVLAEPEQHQAPLIDDRAPWEHAS